MKNNHPRGTKPYVAIGTFRVVEWVVDAAQLRARLTKLLKAEEFMVKDFEFSVGLEKYLNTYGEFLPEAEPKPMPVDVEVKPKVKKTKAKAAQPPDSRNGGRNGKKVKRITRVKNIVRRKTKR